MTAEIVIAALERAGSIDGAASLLDVDRHDVKMLIIRHKIMYPRPTVAPVSGPADADPPLAEMFR